ncbi:MAG: hypothetical protein J0L61_10710 [Planctomycetes bacterium]|nr:hypothetical protein [Planctomycetota bacterium]
MSGSSIHLILILLVFGASALSWVIGKLREQAAIKKMKDEAKRRSEEELRTGRVTSAPAEPSRSSELAELRELAAKRQQQLQQMRQAQKQTAQQRREEAARGPAPFPISVPQSQRPSKPGAPGFPGMPRQGPGVPGAPGTPTQPRARVLEVRVPSRRTKESTPVPIPVIEQESRVRRLVADSPAPTMAAPAAARTAEEGVSRAIPVGFSALLGLRPGTRDTGALKRALVLSEILGPPLATRETGRP